jgi:hypothetical protein
VLVCASDDDHTLGLSLAELCLREVGIGPLWLGRRTPVAELVVVSASSTQTNRKGLTSFAGFHEYLTGEHSAA